MFRTTHAEVTVHNTNQNSDTASIIEATQHSTQLQVTPQLLGDMVEAVSNAIADLMIPPNPLWFLAELERARASGWELTTSQVKELIGVKPSCKQGKKTFFDLNSM